MKKSLLVLELFCFLFLISCQQAKQLENPSRFYVSGQLSNIPDSLVYLAKMGLDGNIGSNVDSCYIENGKFLLSDTSTISKKYFITSLKGTPRQITHGIPSRFFQTFYINPQDTTYISGDILEYGGIAINGSKRIAPDEELDVNSIKENDNQKLFVAFEHKYNAYPLMMDEKLVFPSDQSKGTKVFLQEVKSEGKPGKLVTDKSEETMVFLQEVKSGDEVSDSLFLAHADSPVFLEFVSEKFSEYKNGPISLFSEYKNRGLSLDTLGVLLGKVEGDAKKDIRYAELKRRYAVLNNIQVGNSAVDFPIYDTNGNVSHLKDYKGKLILINFVKTNYRPCRRMESVLTNFISSVQDDRFVCINIYHDYEVTDWSVANRYSDYWITGTTLGNPKNAECQAVRDYDIQFYPRSVLIDQDFNIQTKSNRLRILRRYICEILGKEYDHRAVYKSSIKNITDSIGKVLIEAEESITNEKEAKVVTDLIVNELIEAEESITNENATQGKIEVKMEISTKK